MFIYHKFMMVTPELAHNIIVHLHVMSGFPFPQLVSYPKSNWNLSMTFNYPRNFQFNLNRQQPFIIPLFELISTCPTRKPIHGREQLRSKFEAERHASFVR